MPHPDIVHQTAPTLSLNLNGQTFSSLCSLLGTCFGSIMLYLGVCRQFARHDEKKAAEAQRKPPSRKHMPHKENSTHGMRKARVSVPRAQRQHRSLLARFREGRGAKRRK